MQAVGIHVFAGGFTQGIQRSGFEVKHQLETHGFGIESAEKICGVQCINDEGANWPHVEAQLAYGNPRCTGFSTITSGYDESVHGPWAKCTCDIHQLCNYSAGRYDFVVWESVQQAASTGKPLLDYLVKEVFAPKGYRVAHLFLNAASFGNTQQRKRYFFVAYRDCYRFNVEPPDLPPHELHLYDAIWSLRDRQTRPGRVWKDDYDADTYCDLSPDEWAVVPHLPNGWCLNTYVKYACDWSPERMQITWRMRNSELPFSLHAIMRMNWRRPSPTLHSSCSRWIHPCHDRPITVLEASSIMGWPDIPAGNAPFAQLAKGVCPEVGAWLGRQVQLSYTHAWGADDFESTYNPIKCTWEGRDTMGELEKVFDLTKYTNTKYVENRYECPIQSHRFNVDTSTGRLVRPWRTIAESYRRNHGTDRLGRHLNQSIAEFPEEQEAGAGPDVCGGGTGVDLESQQ